MATPRALVLTGYGINCDDETRFALELAGADATIIHINDLISHPHWLRKYNIRVIPGGFSYGDHTGSGKALAAKINNTLGAESFIENDSLVIGICNGFQVLVSLGLLPALSGAYGEPQVALVHNDSARYIDRWVDLSFTGKSPWVAGLEHMSLPIAHGEGKFYASPDVLASLHTDHLIAARYVSGEICAHQNLPANPNGSLDDIAGITDPTGKIFGLMPHPERAISFTQLPHWTLLKEQYKRSGREIPDEGSGLAFFRNAVKYFE